jgi:DNA-binding response OmpR family regulator
MTSSFDDPVPFGDAREVMDPGVEQDAPQLDAEVILVAEDDTACRKLVVRILERAGYRVLQARDGMEALRISATYPGPIHLLLSDVVMPGANGPQVADFLCARRPTMQVLFMSAWPSTVGRSCRVRSEEATVLAKPFTAEILERRVRALLRSPAAALFDA